MDLIKKEEVEGTESGSHTFPFSMLQRLHPNVLLDTAEIYAQIVSEYPNYEFGIIRDNGAETLQVYWKRVA